MVGDYSTSGSSAKLCEAGTLGTVYRRYLYDRRRKCLTPNMLAGSRTEGSICNPGLAHTSTEHLSNFFTMLAYVYRNEQCDREKTRFLGLEEVKEHARLLWDRTRGHRKMSHVISMVAKWGIVGAGIAVTLAPVIYVYVCLNILFSVPSLPTFAGVACVSSLALLVMTVIKQTVLSSTLTKERQFDAMDLVTSDVIESPDLNTLRKRIGSHLHKGNIHAAFELNKPAAWTKSQSRTILAIVAVGACMWAIRMTALRVGLLEALNDLTDGAKRGGGKLSQSIASAGVRNSVVSFAVLAASAYATAVAWGDLIR